MTILAAIAFVLAQGEPSLESRVATYSAQLADESTRDRARDRLVHFGRPGLALLEKSVIDSASIASIRQEVAFNETLGAAYGPPHLFNFDGNEESLGVLLSRLEIAASMPFQKNSLDLSQKLTLKMEDASFWEALDEICKKASIWYYPATEPLYLNGGVASQKPRVYYGPLMIVLDRVIHQRRITFSAIESDFTIRLLLVWEKSVAPLGATGRYRLAQATEDSGASLIPAAARQQPAGRSAMLVRNPGQGVDLAGLLMPSAKAKSLARVEGTLELEFPARIDEVRFELPAEGFSTPREKSIEGAKVELKSFGPPAAWGATLEASIRFDDPREAAEFRIGMSDVEFIVPGDVKRSGWIGTAKLEKDVYSFSAHWRNGGRAEMPKEVRFRIPRGGVIKNVPFCFKDVDLK